VQLLVKEWDVAGSAGCVQFSKVAAVQGKSFDRKSCVWCNVRVHTRIPVLGNFGTACRSACRRAVDAVFRIR